MASDNDVSTKIKQNFTTDITQISTEKCTITCTNNFNDNTIIAIGDTGGISIQQSCKVDDATCQMKATFDAGIQQIISNIANQTASATSGISAQIAANQVAYDLTQQINNTISQIISSTCAINAINNKNNNYMLFVDDSGGINLDSTGAITSSTCALDNIAKAVAATTDSTSVSQTATIPSVFQYLFLGFGLMFGFIGVIIIVFILKGGVGEVTSAVDHTASEGLGAVSSNPELAAMLLA
jgi:hypothetical protein